MTGMIRTKGMKLIRRGLALSGIFGAWATVQAHDPGLSTARVQVRENTIELSTSLAPADVQALLPGSQHASRKEWTADDFESAKTQLAVLAPALWEFSAGDKIFTGPQVNVEFAAGDSVTFHLVFSHSIGGSDPLVFRSLKLGELPSGHRQYITVSSPRGLVAERLLSAKTPSVAVQLSTFTNTVPDSDPKAGAVPPSAIDFVKLGVKHIWEGYDHLLFLCGLLIVCRTFRSSVGIITSFTLAHSLTLALATLSVVNLPSRLAEPMIAVSILFVGVENLVYRGAEPKGRWVLTFGFGLVHGFGFASVLRDLGIGADGRGVGMPLLTFNLGVELGQVVVAAISLPLLWRLRKTQIFFQRAVPVVSMVVALAGLFWLLKRTLFA
jgi:hydrogenase/urease accessory protein HupE